MHKTKILFVSNIYWNFYNFRKELIDNLISSGHEVHMLANNDNFLDKFKKKKLILHKIKFSSRGTFFINEFFLLFKLYKKIKFIKPEIVLTFTIKPNIYSGLVTKFLGINIINNITGLGSSFLNNKLIKILTLFLYKLSFSKSQLVFFQNKYDRDLFLNLKIVKKDNSEIIPGSGVDTNYFKSNIKIPKNKNIFLFCGRLIRDKGINEFLNAAKLVLKKNDNCEFHIIGEIDEKEKSSIKKSTLDNYLRNKNIKYFGFVQNLKDYYERSSCVILPSYREGLSKSLLEAASMSRPIITSDVPGCIDAVVPSKNGYLVKAKNIESLTNAINKFSKLKYSEKELMGNFSRKIAKNRFQTNVVISNYIKKIREFE